MNTDQQLSLFSGPARPRQRSKRKSRRMPLSTGNVWDLWTQEGQSEKFMALFFLDIRNFTPLAAMHNPSRVIHIIKRVFSACQHIIRIHHGQIIETTGDGFYAAFGFDSPAQDATNDAVRAGLAILNTIERLNSRTFEHDLKQRVDVGIGIHAGPVATEMLRLGDQDHRIVMGYPVNIASRIQAATKELNNNFIISSAVFEKLSAPPHQITHVKTTLKGIVDPIDVVLLGKSYSQAA